MDILQKALIESLDDTRRSCWQIRVFSNQCIALSMCSFLVWCHWRENVHKQLLITAHSFFYMAGRGWDVQCHWIVWALCHLQVENNLMIRCYDWSLFRRWWYLWCSFERWTDKQSSAPGAFLAVKRIVSLSYEDRVVKSGGKNFSHKWLQCEMKVLQYFSV